MIPIDIKAKVKDAGDTIGTYLNGYCSSILSKKHNTYWNNCDRFGLGHIRNLTYELHEIFYEHYKSNRELRNFISFVFSTSLDNSSDALDLITRILRMTPQEIDSHICLCNFFRQHGDRPSSLLKVIFNYDRDSDLIRERFSALDFSTCYYCNRNYINSFTVGKSKKALFTLDHYHQKEKYPAFSLSFFNLIPSCASCNTNVKGRRSVEQYKNPYAADYDFHRKATFALLSTSSVRIVSRDVKCRKYIEDFYINEIYKHHKAEIKEFVTKRMQFTDEIIEKLSDITGFSIQKIKTLLFGEVIQRNHLDIEPLSKLKADLAKQLKITL